MRTQGTSYVVLVAACFGIGAMIGCEKQPAASTPTSGTPAAVTDAAKTATDAAKDMAATVTVEAQKLLDQATAYIKENKLDSADEALKKVEAMKDKLPAEWAAKITDARSLFDKAKAAATALPGGTTPAMPAAPR